MRRNGNRLAQRATSLTILFALILGTVVPTFATTQRRRTRTRRKTTVTRTVVQPARYSTVPADTIIRVRMNEELSSGQARIGDRFTARVTDTVYGDGGSVLIPDGSTVSGRVTSVRKAGRRTPGTLGVSFNSVRLPNGATYAINGSLTDVQSGSTNSDNEGTVKGRDNQKRNAVFIGGGAATGALIGAIAGGGKGAGIGAIIGGALGTGARVYEKEKEAEVKAGTEFGVILNRSISLPEYKAR
jgi:hypothetical protein